MCIRDRIPAARWISELRGDFKQAGKAFINLYAKVEADRTFSQNNPFTGYDTETATLGYTAFSYTHLDWYKRQQLERIRYLQICR